MWLTAEFVSQLSYVTSLPYNGSLKIDNYAAIQWSALGDEKVDLTIHTPELVYGFGTARLLTGVIDFYLEEQDSFVSLQAISAFFCIPATTRNYIGTYPDARVSWSSGHYHFLYENGILRISLPSGKKDDGRI